ncbi:serine/threonine-protein kinase ATR-like, partial [Ylistrum balloti]|uniref:serine/threonine-protein kinase ATR-like n=1 Tax=Ylistrum balloti TaxID=509963 RepID=UPI002905EC33
MSRKKFALTMELFQSARDKGGGGQSVYELRTLLSHLLENFLTDVNKIGESLQQCADESSECFMMLQWFRWLVDAHSDMFLYVPGSPPSDEVHGHSQQPSPPGNEENLSYAFTTWCLTKLLRLLSYSQCINLHEKCIAVVVSLLQLVKWKDSHFYHSLLTNLIHTLADLVQLNEKLYSTDENLNETLTRFIARDDHVRQSLVDPAESSPSNVKLSPAAIQVCTVDMCELLQVNLTELLGHMVEDVGMVTNGLLPAVWGCMCWAVENGNLDLKACSFHIIKEMLEHSGLPTLNVIDYFLSCSVAVLDLMCSGCKGGEKKLVMKVEDNLALVLQGIIHADQATLQPINLSVSQMQYLLAKISVILTMKGLMSLQTTSLLQGVSDMISYILDKVPQSTLSGSIFSPLVTNMFSTLLNHCGQLQNLQFVVSPLVKSVMLQVANIHSVEQVSEGMTSGKEDAQPSQYGQRKRKAETMNKDGRIKLTKCQRMINSKLSFLISMVTDGGAKVLESMTGVCALVQVLITCLQQSRNISRLGYTSFQHWLPLTTCQELVSSAVAALQLCPDWSSDSTNQMLVTILQTFATLLCTYDAGDLDPQDLTTMCWIASLTWIPNDPSCMDMKMAHTKQVVRLSQQLSEKFDNAVKHESLHVLSFLPKDVAPKWRVHVFRQAFGDGECKMRQSALNTFPLLLHHLGPNANHLVYELIHALVDDRDPEIQKTMADTVGKLACVVCRKSVVSSFKTLGTTSTSQTIQCISCDKLQDKESCKSTKERPRLVDPNMFSKFLTLLDTENQEVKLAMINSLRRMFGHIGLRSNNQATMGMLNTCLCLIEDNDYKVRVRFSQIINSLVGDGFSDLNNLMVRKLKTSLDKAREDGNIRLQETILLTVSQLGRLAGDDLILVVIVSLLENLLSPVPLISAVAYEQLKSVAQFKKTKTQDLFMKSRLSICKFLVEAMHQAQVTPGGRSPEAILRDVAKVLDFTDIKLFLQGTKKYMVPHLVSKATPEASSLIKLMATLLNVPSRMKLLLEMIKYTYTYLVCHCGKAEMERAITFLQNETEVDLGGLVRLHFQRTHQELLLRLSTDYSQVFNGLRVLATYDESYQGPKDITTSEQMAAYLQPRLLGVIAFFDSQLLTVSIPLEDKILTLESLTSIIRLMGSKYIGVIRHKVVNTLRIGLKCKDKQMMEVSCRAWNCFVTSLELPFLGQMMSQIIATLLPLLEPLPKQVADIFSYIIVDNREVLHDHFHEIYFLPDIPELAECNGVLKQYVESPSSQSDLKTSLTNSTKGIAHESVDVRRHALSKLLKLLRDEKDKLYEYVNSNETADPVISNLVSLLLQGCRETDPRAQCLYAECIGELGAIDPGRLELMCNNPKADLAKYHANIEEENFALELISEIINAFLAAPESRIQDTAAFALQELLKTYKITEPKTGDGSSGRIWKRFPDHVQEILIPFLSSKYALTNSTKHDWSKQVTPIYCSEKGHNFENWVSTWTGYLSSKVKKGFAREVFLSCSAVIKHNGNLALYILPYVVLQVLRDGTPKDINDIHNEIAEVLNQAKRPDSKQKAANLPHLSTQTIFSVLDYLTKWMHYMTQTKGVDPQTKVPVCHADPTYKAIQAFRQVIAQDLLADACYNCKAYSRALMHFEQFLSSKGHNIQEHLNFMQKLYVALDEPDGVLGVAAIRLAPTLTEQILIHESQGQHQCAQACYEKAIQSEADNVVHHQGLLRNLIELGEHNKALLHATGAVAEKPDWAHHLNAYMVESAWRLGNWSKLESCIKSDKSSRNWAVGIGKILMAAKEQKSEQLRKQLQIVRRDQMAPLSAASMESGSYYRGYEYITRLHMLSEIEESVGVLMDLHTEDSGSSSTKHTSVDLLRQWESRLQVMQCSFRTQEPVLTLRRILFTLAQQTTGQEVDQDIGHWWLWSARIAQRAGHLQTAFSCLLQASDYNLPEVFLERAEWLWTKGEKDQAISCLERGMSIHFEDVSKLKLDGSAQTDNKRKTYAKALLLYGCYSEETSKMESNVILKQYKEVTDVYPDWEDGHFHLAKYYDKIMTTLLEDKDKPDPSRQREFIHHVVKSFGQSLQYGNQYIYQSLPRLLSLWLDFGTSVAEMEKRDVSRNQQLAHKLQIMRTTLAKLNKLVSALGQQLASYQLFTAFSQLISRICHTQPDVFQQLREIIACLFAKFPQQGMWMLMAVSKSSYKVRVSRCKDIFARAEQINPGLQKFVKDSTKLTDRLLELCNKEYTGSNNMSVSQHFKPLKRLLDDSNFSSIILPLQSNMTVMLPSTPGSHATHDPFPAKEVYISGINDVVEILPSLQRPKKISLIGSDGKFYTMMCKPKDDLRKDGRLMEFNDIVNKFLRKDPESRRRQLHIRTYAVVSLSDKCNLIVVHC